MAEKLFHHCKVKFKSRWRNRQYLLKSSLFSLCGFLATETKKGQEKKNDFSKWYWDYSRPIELGPEWNFWVKGAAVRKWKGRHNGRPLSRQGWVWRKGLWGIPGDHSKTTKQTVRVAAEQPWQRWRHRPSLCCKDSCKDCENWVREFKSILQTSAGSSGDLGIGALGVC